MDHRPIPTIRYVDKVKLVKGTRNLIDWWRISVKTRWARCVWKISEKLNENSPFSWNVQGNPRPDCRYHWPVELPTPIHDNFLCNSWKHVQIEGIEISSAYLLSIPGVRIESILIALVNCHTHVIIKFLATFIHQEPWTVAYGELQLKVSVGVSKMKKSKHGEWDESLQLLQAN